MAKFNDKISNQLTAQLPEFVVEQHPKFVTFLKTYYQLLESAEVTLSDINDTDGILLETETNQVNLLILDGGRLGSTRTQLDAGDKVLTEDASVGKFTNGETVTGSTSKATAVIVAEDLDNTRLFVSSQNKLIVGETITGATSGATATITNYRPNPIQNISELVNYKDPDKTIEKFLTQFRNEFLSTLPEQLATGVDKRNLVKNIKSLYQLKGTAEGNRIFFNLLFGDQAETIYPRENILRISDGQWGTRKILRGIDVVGDTSKLIGRTITGETSEATAIVENVFRFNFGANEVTEFVINTDTIEGTFQIGETVQGTESDLNDIFIKTVVTGIPGTKNILNDGALYDANASISLTGGGQGASFQVGDLGGGPLTEIIIDDGGFDFEIGDEIVFTNDETSGTGARAFVQVVNGGFSPETGLESGDTLFLETPTSTNALTKYLDGPVISVEPNSFSGSKTMADIVGAQNDSSNQAISIVGQTSGATATIRFNIHGTPLADGALENNDGAGTYNTADSIIDERCRDFNPTVLYITYTGADLFQKGETVTYTASDSTTFTFRLRSDFGREGIGINREGIDETNIADRDSIYQMVRNLGANTNEDDHIVLEDATTEGDQYAGDKIVQERNTGIGDITDTFLISGGQGYKTLPTLGFTRADGTSTSSGKDFILKTFGTEIGRILSINTVEHGIQHELSPTPPSIEFINNSIVTSVTGSFNTGETVTGLTSGFTAEVNSYDAARGLLRLDAVTGGPQVGELIRGSSSLAQGTLHVTDHASATVDVVSVADTDGAFLNEDGKLSETTMKVQDSLYYQDFSYVIKVGDSINTWRNSFEKTMHTAGFYFSGEVAITSRLNLRTRAPVVGDISGVAESPLLGVLTTIFAVNFRRKLGTDSDGTTLRANPNLAHAGILNRPASNTRDVTLTLTHRVPSLVSRVRRSDINGFRNITRGFAYAGPTYASINKYHNTAFKGGDRSNPSGITFDILSDIRIIGTGTDFDGQPAIFRMTSNEDARRMKTNFTFPSEITTAGSGAAGSSYDNNVIRYSTTNNTFDEA